MFSVRTYRSFVLVRSAYAVGAPDVSSVRPWMTFSYIARTYRVPQTVLAERLGAAPDCVAAVEHRHIETSPEGEREEVREIFRQRGLQGNLLERVAETITADRDRWVRIMLRDEYGLPAAIRSPWRAAGTTFSAFVLCGLVPLIPFVARLPEPFWVAAAATGLVFAPVGALKGRWSIRPWWRLGLETLAIGGGAAAVAYGIGAWLRHLVG